MNPRHGMTALLFGMLALLPLVSTSCGRGGGETAPEATPVDQPVPGPQPSEVVPGEEPAPGQPLKRHTVEVYFPAAAGNGLIGEYSEIFETVTPGDRAKQIVADLISGPSNPDALQALPSGTRLRQAYVLEDGTAYLDFTADLVEGVGGGSMEELLTVYAIVDSVVLNVGEITRVGILIEGETVDTLNGHMDLRRPLRPNTSLILAPTVVQGPRVSTGELIAATAQPE